MTPTPIQTIEINQVEWLEYQSQLSAIRRTVFVEEQKVPIALEWDDQDASAQHLLALSYSNEPIACARLLSSGSIGRMAVLKAWRGMGVGAKLLNKAIALHRQQGVSAIKLSAQVHSILFYQQAGFKVVSEPYLDGGILHVDMQLIVDNSEHRLSND